MSNTLMETWFPARARARLGSATATDTTGPAEHRMPDERQPRVIAFPPSGCGEDMFSSEGCGVRRAPSPLLGWVAARRGIMLAMQAPGEIGMGFHLGGGACACIIGQTTGRWLSASGLGNPNIPCTHCPATVLARCLTETWFLWNVSPCYIMCRTWKPAARATLHQRTGYGHTGTAGTGR